MAGHVHTADVSWKLEGSLDRGKYSRLHSWRFDGGVDVPASASPSVVPLPWSSETAVDPEEAFIAAISSCHMLTFIDIARREGVRVVAYEDSAEGLLEAVSGEASPRRMGITRVMLRPRLTLEGDTIPDASVLQALHETAHELCFIANSVACEIVVEAQPVTMAV